MALSTTGQFRYVHRNKSTYQPFLSPPGGGGGGGGVTICHFTRQCLFVRSLNLSAVASVTCGPTFSLWVLNKYHRVDLCANHESGLSGQPQT